MAEKEQERKVSLSITIRVDSLEQSAAQALEDAVRDAADDYKAEVLASRGPERVTVARP